MSQRGCVWLNVVRASAIAASVAGSFLIIVVWYLKINKNGFTAFFVS
jgi:hypothetical protein